MLWAMTSSRGGDDISENGCKFVGKGGEGGAADGSGGMLYGGGGSRLRFNAVFTVFKKLQLTATLPCPLCWQQINRER
jgi:hypothetical protein